MSESEHHYDGNRRCYNCQFPEGVIAGKPCFNRGVHHSAYMEGFDAGMAEARRKIRETLGL